QRGRLGLRQRRARDRGAARGERVRPQRLEALHHERGCRPAVRLLREDRPVGRARRDQRVRRRGGRARLPGRAHRAEDGDQGVDDGRALLRRLPRPGREPARRGGRGPRARDARPRALAYARTRETFGEPIGRHQLVAGMLADMATRCEAARGLLYRCGAAIDEGADGPDLTKLSAMTKLFCTDVAMTVTTDAVQVLGGYGYIQEHPVERMMRDAKITQIYEGTNQIQRLVVARELLRR